MGIVGLICFAWGGISTLTRDMVIWLGFPGAHVHPLAALQPADVQAWLPVINTALLVVGGTLIGLYQKANSVRREEEKANEEAHRASLTVKVENQGQQIRDLEGQVSSLQKNQCPWPALEQARCRGQPEPTPFSDAERTHWNAK